MPNPTEMGRSQLQLPTSSLSVRNFLKLKQLGAEGNPISERIHPSLFVISSDDVGVFTMLVPRLVLF
jgi:hypothetical protein